MCMHSTTHWHEGTAARHRRRRHLGMGRLARAARSRLGLQESLACGSWSSELPDSLFDEMWPVWIWLLSLEFQAAPCGEGWEED